MIIKGDNFRVVEGEEAAASLRAHFAAPDPIVSSGFPALDVRRSSDLDAAYVRRVLLANPFGFGRVRLVTAP